MRARARSALAARGAGDARDLADHGAVAEVLEQQPELASFDVDLVPVALRRAHRHLVGEQLVEAAFALVEVEVVGDGAVLRVLGRDLEDHGARRARWPVRRSAAASEPAGRRCRRPRRWCRARPPRRVVAEVITPVERSASVTKEASASAVVAGTSTMCPPRVARVADTMTTVAGRAQGFGAARPPPVASAPCPGAAAPSSSRRSAARRTRSTRTSWSARSWPTAWRPVDDGRGRRPRRRQHLRLHRGGPPGVDRHRARPRRPQGRRRRARRHRLHGRALRRRAGRGPARGRRGGRLRRAGHPRPQAGRAAAARASTC